MNDHFSKTETGFSLIEIAIVLMIGGLIFSMSLSLFRPIQTMQANVLTKQKVERIMNAISTYALQKNALPCPGLPDAVAPDTPGTAPQNCFNGSTPAVWGIIPYVTLGLAQPDVIDGSGHYMTYVVPRVLTKPVGNAATDGQMTAIFKGNVASNFCGNAALQPDKLLSVNRPDQKIVEPNIAVAIIAYGVDGFGAYNPGMANSRLRRCPIGAGDCQAFISDNAGDACNTNDSPLDRLLGETTHERDNAVDRAGCSTNNVIHVSDYSNQAGANHFDDQVLYASGTGLINRLGMAGCSQ